MTAPPSLRDHLARYFRTLSVRQLASLWLEDWLGWLVRSLPGAIGYGGRWLLYRLLFARLAGVCFIYPGARILHAYGIRAGRNLRINSGVFIDARGGLTIGDDVLIGPNAVIVTSEHQWDDPDRPIAEQGQRAAPVTIGDDVWVGAGAVVLPGITLAQGTVVGAGSVITRDTAPYTIVGGVPARPLGERRRPLA